MTITAAELFELYSTRQEQKGGFRKEPPWFERHSAGEQLDSGENPRIRMSGTVDRTLLGADKAASIVLRADPRGFATVVCRCTSDEVLWQVAPEDSVVVEGVCRGLEDSLTLIVELGELVGPRRQLARFLQVVPGGREIRPAVFERRECDLCGKKVPERELLSVCQACASQRASAPERGDDG